MTALSEAVRALLPPEMPKERISVRQTSNGYQATWGSHVKVVVTHEEAKVVPPTEIPLAVASRLVGAVFAYVTEKAAEAADAEVDRTEAGANAAEAVRRGALTLPDDSDPALLVNVLAPEPESLDEMRAMVDQVNLNALVRHRPDLLPVALAKAVSPRAVAAPAAERKPWSTPMLYTLTDTEVDAINSARLNKPASPFKADTSMGWVARHTATFPAFPAHTSCLELSITEHDALDAWAARQDPKSGRGEIIYTLLNVSVDAESTSNLLAAAIDVFADVAGDLELLRDDEPKSGAALKVKLNAAIKKLEAGKEKAES